MMTSTVSLATLGCKTNQFESAAMEEQLQDAGYQVVPFNQGADLVVINTCTVTAATDAQSRNLIRRARRLNPACRVVVTGCYAQIDPQPLMQLPGVALVLGNAEKKDLLSYLGMGRDGLVQVGDIRTQSTAEVPALSSFAGRSRAFLQIQNGCDAFCSYCIIPYARGRSRSVPVDQVLAQVQRLLAAGFPEIVLTGIHIGCYGLDFQTTFPLVKLVEQICQDTTITRLRLGSLEPLEISDELIERVAISPVLCRHFHIPLQAGDDNVLQRMGRNYSTATFATLVEKIHKRMPDAAIGLDVICGFPGETDQEFENTFNFLKNLPFTHLHVFPFSRRPGTPAAQMPDQVPTSIAKERAARLRSLGEEKLVHFCKSFIGTSLEVVSESGDREPRWKGLTRNYLHVKVDGSAPSSGQCRFVRILQVESSELVGMTEPDGGI